MSSTPLMKKNVCQNCKVACNSGKSNNFVCPRCRFMDSLPMIKSSSKEEEEACSICLVDFNSKGAVINELPCRHQFHRECIYEWIGRRSKYSCPLCRYKLPIDDTIMRRPTNNGLIPARYELINGDRVYFPPPDRTMVMFLTPNGGYYGPRPLMRTTIPRPQVVVRTNNTSGGGGGRTTSSTVDNNTTIILQDEDGDSVMLDNNTILQDEDGDTFMIDAYLA